MVAFTLRVRGTKRFERRVEAGEIAQVEQTFQRAPRHALGQIHRDTGFGGERVESSQ